MLVKTAPDAYDKLRLLGGMAGDDVLSEDAARRFNMPRNAYSQFRNRDMPAGVYKAIMPNGKTISLMRVMFTDVCKYDCFYCPNSTWVPRRRYGFKVDELSKLFMEMHGRHTVDGLFLSSGISGSPDKTMSKLIDVVDVVRNRYKFKGYIHLKVMPGATEEYLEAAYRLGTRLSINIETPSHAHMERLSTMKDYQSHILDPMSAIHRLIKAEDKGGAVGQATQMVVGAADESDWDIYQRMTQLYGQWGFKRVYYQPFRPARYTPLEEHPATPMMRAHRLYQTDWLSRIYGYSAEELKPAFDYKGHLSLDVDPKLQVALDQLWGNIVDVNHADYRQLIRVPGVGPTSAERIVKYRAEHQIDTWRDLQAMGVVVKRAKAFVGFNGYKPEQSRQLKMDFTLGDKARTETRPMRELPVASKGGGCSSCVTSACGSCPVAGLRAASPVLAGVGV